MKISSDFNDSLKGAVNTLLVEHHDEINHCIQIGACDGVINDFYRPIQKLTNIPSLLIEPVPERFNKLVHNYEEHSNCEFMNVAIDVEQSTRKLLYPNNPHISFGSFYPQHANRVKADMIKCDVQCITWNEVLREDTNMIIIDVDGHELVLLEELFGKYKTFPDIIIWESFRELKPILKLMRYNGYDTTHFGLDSISIKKGP